MLRSMTAYAKCSAENETVRFTVEMQSLNRKFLECSLNMPGEFNQYDLEIRKLVAKEITRGQLNIKVFASYHRDSPIAATPNLALAKEIKKALSEIANELGISEQPFKMDWLLTNSYLISYQEKQEDADVYKRPLFEAIQAALQKLLTMKDAEGALLQHDIERRLDRLGEYIQKIEELAPESSKKYRQKLFEKLEELKPGLLQEDERLLKEVSIFAERVDITEEITRFRAHLKRVKEMVASPSTSEGKSIEFLLQEFGREINTIGSKCQDAAIAHLVVNAKSEIEKIREQIQNVE